MNQRIQFNATRTHATFENNFVSILDEHATKKTKVLRRNQKPRFNKNLPKQIMMNNESGKENK